MSEIKISEAGTVQFPMVNHAVGIGLTPITPEVAKQKRGGGIGHDVRGRNRPKAKAVQRPSAA